MVPAVKSLEGKVFLIKRTVAHSVSAMPNEVETVAAVHYLFMQDSQTLITVGSLSDYQIHIIVSCKSKLVPS